MKPYVIKILPAFILMLCLPLFAQNLEDRTRDIGVTAAYWLEGDVYVDGNEGTKESAFLLRTFADFYLMPKLAMGMYFNMSPFTQNGYDITIYEFGGSIKPRFFLEKDLALKPGLNIGYRWTTADYNSMEIDAFGVNLSVELQKQLKNMIIHGEFGFLSQPAGGNDVFEVTFAPIIYFGGGITF